MPKLHVIPCGFYMNTEETKDFEAVFRGKVPKKKVPFKPLPEPPPAKDTAESKRKRATANAVMKAQAEELEYFHLLAEHLAAQAEWTCVQARVKHQKAVAKGDRVLIVFLAPEFYFRGPFAEREGPDPDDETKTKKLKGGRPFSRATALAGIEYLRGELNQDDETLILPGTVWWAEPDEKSRDAKTGQVKKHYVHNSLPIFHDSKIVHTYHKLAPAAGDDMDLSAEVWDRDFAKDQKVFEKAGPVFDLDLKGLPRKLKVGVEICLDHFYDVVGKAAPRKDLDLQCLVACGMAFSESHFALRTGGCFARMDGKVTNKSGQFHALGKKAGKPDTEKVVYGPKAVRQVGTGACYIADEPITMEITK